MRQNGVVTSSPNQLRPTYLRPGNVGLVFLGGMCGVFARELLMLAVPDAGGIPAAVLIANVLGALLLGFLLESLGALGSSGPDTGRRQSLRLLLGTGVLGGFTTYSALAQTVLVLWSDGAAWFAAAYGLGTLLCGGLATWCGILLAGGLTRARERKRGHRE